MGVWPVGGPTCSHRHRHRPCRRTLNPHHGVGPQRWSPSCLPGPPCLRSSHPTCRGALPCNNHTTVKVQLLLHQQHHPAGAPAHSPTLPAKKGSRQARHPQPCTCILNSQVCMLARCSCLPASHVSVHALCCESRGLRVTIAQAARTSQPSHDLTHGIDSFQDLGFIELRRKWGWSLKREGERWGVAPPTARVRRPGAGTWVDQ